mgnify:CR=1 FL=1
MKKSKDQKKKNFSIFLKKKKKLLNDSYLIFMYRVAKFISLKKRKKNLQMMLLNYIYIYIYIFLIKIE